MTLEEQVLKTIEEYDMLPPGTRVLVGVSGGADSVCLLTLLNALHRKGRVHIDGLRAVHVHHGLRASADEDEQYVRQLCGELKVPLAVYHVDAAAEAARRGMSVEEAGRALRREAFQRECAAWDRKSCGEGSVKVQEEAARAAGLAAAGDSRAHAAESVPEREEGTQAADLAAAGDGRGPSAAQAAERGTCRVALAHHMEDSAETLLFNLCRGSSAAGLAGIRPVSIPETHLVDLDLRADASEESFASFAAAIIRPLIRASRGEIEAWLAQNGWTWRTDETNADTRYTRNYLRQEIFPALERHVNTGAARHLAKAALEWSEAEEALREETRRRLASCRIMTERAGSAYSVPKLKNNTLFWRRRMLYEAMVQAADGRVPGNSDDKMRGYDTGGFQTDTAQDAVPTERPYPTKNVTSTHIEALLHLLETTGSARVDLPYGMTARKEYEALTFERKLPSQGTPEAGKYPEEASIEPAAATLEDLTAPEADALCPSGGGDDVSPNRQGLALSAKQYSVRIFTYRAGMEIPTGPCTKWFDYDTITQSLSFRGRRKGDVIALGRDGDGGWRYKKLSRVMIDRKVPERLRDAIVLPMDGSHVLWFPGYRIGAEYRVTDQTRTVLEIRLAAQDASEER